MSSTSLGPFEPHIKTLTEMSKLFGASGFTYKDNVLSFELERKIIRIFALLHASDACELTSTLEFGIPYSDYPKNISAKKFKVLANQFPLRVLGPKLLELFENPKTAESLDINQVYKNLFNANSQLARTPLWSYLDSIIRPKLEQQLEGIDHSFHFCIQLREGEYSLESRTQKSFIDFSEKTKQLISSKLQTAADDLKIHFKSKTFTQSLNELKEVLPEKDEKTKVKSVLDLEELKKSLDNASNNAELTSDSSESHPVFGKSSLSKLKVEKIPLKAAPKPLLTIKDQVISAKPKPKKRPHEEESSSSESYRAPVLAAPAAAAAAVALKKMKPLYALTPQVNLLKKAPAMAASAAGSKKKKILSQSDKKFKSAKKAKSTDKVVFQTKAKGLGGKFS
ncbi:MAG: hypothetical protein LLG04_17855 [Parachlamydia sp.]|nr:hypothetical protein [Parachlamydia sp.]